MGKWDWDGFGWFLFLIVKLIHRILKEKESFFYLLNSVTPVNDTDFATSDRDILSECTVFYRRTFRYRKTPKASWQHSFLKWTPLTNEKQTLCKGPLTQKKLKPWRAWSSTNHQVQMDFLPSSTKFFGRYLVVNLIPWLRFWLWLPPSNIKMRGYKTCCKKGTPGLIKRIKAIYSKSNKLLFKNCATSNTRSDWIM